MGASSVPNGTNGSGSVSRHRKTVSWRLIRAAVAATGPRGPVAAGGVHTIVGCLSHLSSVAVPSSPVRAPQSSPS